MGFQYFAPVKGFLPLTELTIIISLLIISSSLKRVSMEKVEMHKDSANVNIYDSKSELELSLAKYIGDLSKKFAKERGAFSIAISGDSLGRTWSLLMEPTVAIDWSKWYVFWADERVVPKDNPQSNYKLAYDEFLSKVPIPEDHIISINDKLSAEGAAIDYESHLKLSVKNKALAISNSTHFPKFDLMILGLGYNGHIASLFPNQPQLKENKKWVTYITNSPKPPPKRITVTFPVINSCSNVAFVVVGKDKASIVNETFNGSERLTSIPAKMVSPEGELKWFLDKDAALSLKI